MSSNHDGLSLRRLLVALLGFPVLLVLGFVGFATEMSQGVPLTWWLWLASGATILGAFMALAQISTARAPWRGARVVAVFAELVIGYLLMALPWPPHGPALGSALVLGSLALLIAGGVLARTKFPRFALSASGLVAGYALLGEIGLTWRFYHEPIPASGPAVGLSYLLVQVVNCAGLAMMIAILPRNDTKS